MDDRNTPEEPAKDREGLVGGIVVLVMVFFALVVLTGTAGVYLAVGFLALWAVFAVLGRLFTKKQ